MIVLGQCPREQGTELFLLCVILFKLSFSVNALSMVTVAIYQNIQNIDKILVKKLEQNSAH